MKDLRIIIIGAGIGGLTTGIALCQAGYAVEIYERVSEFRPVGAGISLWSNGVKVLQTLGLDLASIGGQMDRMQYLSFQGELWNDIDLKPLIAQVSQRPYPVARSELQQMLQRHFSGRIHFNAKCVGVDQTSGGARAFFANGDEVTADLIIGADGIHSVVRDYVLERPTVLRYAGYVNVNGLVRLSQELADPNTWVIYVGEYKRASLMPVGGNRFYFFFDLPVTEDTAPHPQGIRAELLESFQHWSHPIPSLVQALDPSTTNRLLIRDRDPLETFVRGQVVLLGDAAHTTTPDLGQGACQALEDAYVLSRYLVESLTLEEALKRYEQDRVPRTREIVLKARRRTDQIHGKDPNLTQKWYNQLQQEAPEAVIQAIANTILGGPLR
jgi:FAD-dependent urate hydroxylase